MNIMVAKKKPSASKAGSSTKKTPKKKVEPFAEPTPEKRAILDQFCAYNTLGWAPIITPVACGMPAKKLPAQKEDGTVGERVATLCSINSLAISLRAARTLNEGEDITHVEAQEIIGILYDEPT